MIRVPHAAMALLASFSLTAYAGAGKRTPATADDVLVYQEYFACTMPSDFKSLSAASPGNVVLMDLGSSDKSPRLASRASIHREFESQDGNVRVNLEMNYRPASGQQRERMEMRCGVSVKQVDNWTVVGGQTTPFGVDFPIDPRTTYGFKVRKTVYTPSFVLECEYKRKRLTSDCTDCRRGD